MKIEEEKKKKLKRQALLLMNVKNINKYSSGIAETTLAVFLVDFFSVSFFCLPISLAHSLAYTLCASFFPCSFFFLLFQMCNSFDIFCERMRFLVRACLSMCVCMFTLLQCYNDIFFLDAVLLLRFPFLSTDCIKNAMHITCNVCKCMYF